MAKIPFPQEIAKNYWGITHNGQDLQYSATQLHWAWNWVSFEKEPEWLSEKSIHDITNFDNPSNIGKNLKVTLLFVDFSKVFDSIDKWKIKQILVAYSLLKETVTVIMMIYKNTKVKVRSLDETQTSLTLSPVCCKETH